MPDNNVIGLEGISKILHTFYRHCCQQKVTFCRCQAISDFSLTSWEETERDFLQVLTLALGNSDAVCSNTSNSISFESYFY